MNRYTLLILLAIVLLLSGLFGFYHYTAITSTIEEASFFSANPHRKKDDLQKVTLPQEFVDFVKQGDASSQGSLSNDIFALKKFGFTSCLHQISSTTNFWKKEGSGGNFLKNSHASLDQAALIEESAKAYGAAHVSKTDQKDDLLISTCLDFYDSKELQDALTTAKGLK